MRKLVWVFAMVAAYLLDVPGARATATTTTATDDPAAASVQEGLPFQLGHQFLIVVKGTVGGVGPLRLIVDTGSTRSIVTQSVAKQLGGTKKNAMVLNFNRQIKVESLTVLEVRIGPIVARNVTMLVAEPKDDSELFADVDGLIGLDVLLQGCDDLRVDYRTHRIAFGRLNGRESIPPFRVLTVELTVQGQPVRLVLDSGIQNMLLYEDRIHKHCPGIQLSHRRKAREGRLKGTIADVSGIELAGKEVQMTAFLVTAPKTLITDDIDGFVGFSVFQSEMVELDFRSNVVHWR